MTIEDTDRELPFLSHLLELRDRLLRMLLGIAVVFLVLMPFANTIYTFIAQPLLKNMPAGTTMIATQVASPFLAPFKLTLVAAVFLAMPYILHQFWGFVAPGLYQHERRLVVPLIVSSVFLFYLGAAFAYFIVFPMIFAFFTATAPEGVAVMTDINSYLDFVLTLFFAFGVAFEVPIATILLVWMGVLEPEKLRGMRPYVIVGAFVVGMFLTPPDVFSQTFLAVPMWLLFEAGVYMSRFFRPASAEAPDTPEATGAGGAAAVPVVAGAPDYRHMTPDEMEAELDRIEGEELAARERERAAARAAEEAEAGEEDEEDEATTEREHERETDADAVDKEPDPGDPFGRRAAAQAKLERVMALRASGDVVEARQLLYEVLVEGGEDQVFVARNILSELDQPG
jgi:sec-independent protein translocase protein TatC